jgi:hypothetical protein
MERCLADSNRILGIFRLSSSVPGEKAALPVKETGIISDNCLKWPYFTGR